MATTTTLWTPQTMYIGGKMTGPRRLTPAFDAEMNRETRWVRIGPKPLVPVEDQEAVGLGRKPCPLCHNTTKVTVLCRGAVTGIEMERPTDCPCTALRTFWSLWGRVDKRYRAASIDAIEPYARLPLSMDRQQTIITDLRERPDDSYLLVGPSGTGKTTLMAALYRRAVARSIAERGVAAKWDPSVWFTDTASLLDQHVALATASAEDKADGKVEIPYVTPEVIRRRSEQGVRVTLCLEEVSQLKPTDFKTKKLREIVEAVYANEGQIVATSNETPEQIAALWGQATPGGEKVAEAILRRICGDVGAHLIVFE